MIKLRNLIPEDISVNRKDKNKEIFNYNHLIDNAWRQLVYNAQKFQNIHFDLENNNTTGQKRTFYIKKNLRKNQPVKYEVNAELYRAGGDWEFPVYYFKIELTHDFGSLQSSKYKSKPEYIWDIENKDIDLYNNYVIIPSAEVGNSLKKEGEKEFAFTSEDDEYDNFDVTGIDVKLWRWLEELIEKAVNDRHIQLD